MDTQREVPSYIALLNQLRQLNKMSIEVSGDFFLLKSDSPFFAYSMVFIGKMKFIEIILWTNFAIKRIYKRFHGVGGNKINNTILTLYSYNNSEFLPRKKYILEISL